MTVQEMLAEKRERDGHAGSVVQHVEGESQRDSHTGATVLPIFLVIQGAGHGLSYEVWEWAHGEDDEYGEGTFACVLDGYGIGRHGSEMNFEGWRPSSDGYVRA